MSAVFFERIYALTWSTPVFEDSVVQVKRSVSRITVQEIIVFYGGYSIIQIILNYV